VDNVPNINVVESFNMWKVSLSLEIHIVIQFMNGLSQYFKDVAANSTRGYVLLVLRVAYPHTFSDLVDRPSRLIADDYFHFILHGPYRIHLFNVIHLQRMLLYLICRLVRPFRCFVAVKFRSLDLWKLVAVSCLLFLVPRCIIALDCQGSMTILPEHYVRPINVVKFVLYFFE